MPGKHHKGAPIIAFRTPSGVGAATVIPAHANRRDQRPYDKDQYKHRNLIERLFLRIKNFRRIATRYDKPVLSKVGGLAEWFSSFITIVTIFLWLV